MIIQRPCLSPYHISDKGDIMEFNRENTEKEFRERIVGLSGVFGPSGFEDEVANL